MIAVPAVDLHEGRCVQLVGGRLEEERVNLPMPSNVALRWWDTGFKQLHVVDLDAAMGRGDNNALVGEVVVASPADTQVGGGVRDDDRAEFLFGAGANRVIVGTRAVDDPAWLARLVKRFPGRIVVAADIRDGMVLKKGWTEASRLKVDAFLEGLSELDLAGVLCTDVDREGRMQGIDLPEMKAVIAASKHPVQVSGGITSMDDLDALADAGAVSCVLGMALYTGTLDPAKVAEKYGGAS